jgi:antitoxin (DNA-binding transcriptional repressor) of toxin-antitoxin stability system
MVMNVRIAELKSQLSSHLRAVRRGKTITVLDRDTPIARILPYRDEIEPLRSRGPEPGAPPLGKVPLPPPLDLGFDVVDILLEDRAKR